MDASVDAHVSLLKRSDRVAGMGRTYNGSYPDCCPMVVTSASSFIEICGVQTDRDWLCDGVCGNSGSFWWGYIHIWYYCFVHGVAHSATATGTLVTGGLLDQGNRKRNVFPENNVGEGRSVLYSISDVMMTLEQLASHPLQYIIR